ncbi:hypothetical protein C1884_02150 [Pseudomonas sp. GW460-R15]|nr:hypothetical protein C1887_02600 [Pseudomonas sp. GW456-R21]POA70951.1 hypothetical protein C1884_02150 [Pseudomonas sp. GW460-R15]
MTVWRHGDYRQMKICSISVARGLAPVGSRSGPKAFATAAQPNGGKPPRHKRSSSHYRRINRRGLLPTWVTDASFEGCV